MEGCLAGVDDLLQQYYTVGGHCDDKNAGYCCARCTVLLCCRLFIVQKLIPQTGLFRCNVKWWIAAAAATTLWRWIAECVRLLWWWIGHLSAAADAAAATVWIRGQRLWAGQWNLWIWRIVWCSLRLNGKDGLIVPQWLLIVDRTAEDAVRIGWRCGNVIVGVAMILIRTRRI